MESRAVLIVDPDREFLDSLRADPKAEMIPAVLSDSGKEAQAVLSDPRRKLLGVFINPATTTPGGGPGGLSVIRSAHLHRPALPIHLIYEGAKPFSERELKSLGVQTALQKPVTFTRIFSIVQPVAHFDPRAGLAANAGGSKESAGTEVAEADDGFVPLRALDFLTGARSLFDLFVRLGAGRYLKILNAGDDFTLERLAAYIEKDVKYFYIRKETQLQYVSYCNQIAGRVVKGNGISVKLKSSQVLNHGEQVMSFLRMQGLSEENLAYATGFVDNVGKLVHELKPERHDLLRGFVADFTSYQHGVAVSIIACLIARQLGIGSDESLRIVGISALLHDIGLFAMPDEVHHEDRAKMSPEHKKLFETHPMTGALILKGIRAIHPTVVQAVSQHHERADQRGFPARIGLGRVNRVAEIVGLSDEFVRIIVEARAAGDHSGVDARTRSALSGFSQQTFEAFLKVFFPVKKEAIA
jgi:putative nucleotidyltransferase with HDIG domain